MEDTNFLMGVTGILIGVIGILITVLLGIPSFVVTWSIFQDKLVTGLRRFRDKLAARSRRSQDNRVAALQRFQDKLAARSRRSLEKEIARIDSPEYHTIQQQRAWTWVSSYAFLPVNSQLYSLYGS
jgi:hypothetical protein